MRVRFLRAKRANRNDNARVMLRHQQLQRTGLHFRRHQAVKRNRVAVDLELGCFVSQQLDAFAADGFDVIASYKSLGVSKNINVTLK